VSTVAAAAAAAFGVATATATYAALGARRRVRGRIAVYRPDRVAAVVTDGAVWRAASRNRWFGGAIGRSFGAPAGAAGMAKRTVDETLRVRQAVHGAAFAAAGLVLGAVVLHSAALTLLLVAAGTAVGLTRAPARAARAAEERRGRMRLELVTVNQLLAMHVRAGAGPVQAVTRIVERGRGIVVDELRTVLTSIRAGRSEADAFRHAAATTNEPHAARTYRLFALAAEHGADLGTALRALSDDIRQVRREELRRQATRRRAAMLVPTIAVLAPIMLLFVIAPLPSIVLGGR